MNQDKQDRAIVYCEGAYATTNGKTAHGLVRRCDRYRILSVIDSTVAGSDARELIDGSPNGIPIVSSLYEALAAADAAETPATHLIVGLAPDGGRLPHAAREDMYAAVAKGLHIVSGLHDFLSEDEELVRLAEERGVVLTDIRKPPARQDLHFFSGKIEEVTSLRIAVLGTDSAVGKRTTAWKLVDGFRAAGKSAELVGTGQTAWLQGATYSIVFDSLVNDFVSGEIEHAVWSAWSQRHPDVIVIEGQGSLMNPAYPGGFEILAAGRPHCVVMQHVPGRRDYDGFPGYPLHPLKKQIEAVELISSKPVLAVTINGEGLTLSEESRVCSQISAETGLPVVNPITSSINPIIDILTRWHPTEQHRVGE